MKEYLFTTFFGKLLQEEGENTSIHTLDLSKEESSEIVITQALQYIHTSR
jgi:hypothetical protein